MSEIRLALTAYTHSLWYSEAKMALLRFQAGSWYWYLVTFGKHRQCSRRGHRMPWWPPRSGDHRLRLGFTITGEQISLTPPASLGPQAWDDHLDLLGDQLPRWTYDTGFLGA